MCSTQVCTLSTGIRLSVLSYNRDTQFLAGCSLCDFSLGPEWLCPDLWCVPSQRGHVTCHANTHTHPPSPPRKKTHAQLYTKKHLKRFNVSKDNTAIKLAFVTTCTSGFWKAYSSSIVPFLLWCLGSEGRRTLIVPSLFVHPAQSILDQWSNFPSFILTPSHSVHMTCSCTFSHCLMAFSSWTYCHVFSTHMESECPLPTDYVPNLTRTSPILRQGS